MKGRAKTTSAESVGLVHIISATAPISRTTLRRGDGDARPEGALDLGGIRRQARGDLAGPGGIEEGRIEDRQPGEDGGA